MFFLPGNPATEMPSTLTSETMVTNVTNDVVTSRTGVTNVTTTEMKTQEGDNRTTSMTSAVPSIKVSTKGKVSTNMPSTKVSTTDKGMGMSSITVSTQEMGTTPTMSQVNGVSIMVHSDFQDGYLPLLVFCVVTRVAQTNIRNAQSCCESLASAVVGRFKRWSLNAEDYIKGVLLF